MIKFHVFFSKYHNIIKFILNLIDITLSILCVSLNGELLNELSVSISIINSLF